MQSISIKFHIKTDKLNLTPRFGKMNKALVKIIKSSKLKKFVKAYFDNMIEMQKDARGVKFPKKKDATIEAYKKKGWNTTQWLVATGKSRTVRTKTSARKVEFFPVGFRFPYPILNQQLEDNDRKSGRPVDWFKFNDKFKNEVLLFIKKEMKRKRV